MAQSQSKTGNLKLAQSPTAPPAYRPQPVPKVLQMKKGGQPQTGAGRFPVPVSAPVYRPAQQRIVQPQNALTAQSRKPGQAPAVYRPEPKLFQPQQPPQRVRGQAAQMKPAGQRPTGPALQTRSASRPQMPGVQTGPSNRLAQSRSIQRYRTLSGDKIYNHMPQNKPWFGYPYAVVGAAIFPAQAPALGVGGNDQFLTQANGNQANVVNHNGMGLSLRVSDDNNIAIEDSDLTQRQPKVFYATQAVVNSSNQLLTQAGSKFTLQTGGMGLRILTGWYSTKTLVRVSPVYHQNGHVVNANQAPQNCNEIASEVTGIWNPANRGGTLAVDVASRIADRDGLDDIDDAAARDYVSLSRDFPIRAEQMGANQYARPEVGESFMIASLGTPTMLPNGKARIRDIESGQDRDLDWAYHFGGVVARSGSDRITLENYARGDNRQGNADPRWYFQMYGEKHNQSFHEFFKAKQEYANPVTVNLRNTNHGPIPELPRLRPLPTLADIMAAM